MRTERLQIKLVHLNSRSYNGEIVELQSALNDDFNNFSGKIKHVSHLRAHNWKIFPKPCACTFSSEQFRWFIQLHIKTLQHFAKFWCLFRPVMSSRSILELTRSFSLSVFLFLVFIAIGHCLTIFSTRTCWISNNYHHFGATRPRCTRKSECIHARSWRWGWSNFL